MGSTGIKFYTDFLINDFRAILKRTGTDFVNVPLPAWELRDWLGLLMNGFITRTWLRKRLEDDIRRRRQKGLTLTHFKIVNQIVRSDNGIKW